MGVVVARGLFEAESDYPKGMDHTNYFWQRNYRDSKNRPPCSVFFTALKDCGSSHVMIHDYIGPDFDYAIGVEEDTIYQTLEDLPAGTWIYEGSLAYDYDYGTGEQDTWIEGSHRPLTNLEIESLALNDEPWDPSLWGPEWESKKGRAKAMESFSDLSVQAKMEFERLLEGEKLPFFMSHMEKWSLDEFFHESMKAIEENNPTTAYDMTSKLMGQMVYAIYKTHCGELK